MRIKSDYIGFLECLILIDETDCFKQAQVNRSSFDIVDGLLYQKP
jgi:hypothetical protein